MWAVTDVSFLCQFGLAAHHVPARVCMFPIAANVTVAYAVVSQCWLQRGTDGAGTCEEALAISGDKLGGEPD